MDRDVRELLSFADFIEGLPWVEPADYLQHEGLDAFHMSVFEFLPGVPASFSAWLWRRYRPGIRLSDARDFPAAGAAAVALGLPMSVANGLMLGHVWSGHSVNDIGPRYVAVVLRHLAFSGRVDWRGVVGVRSVARLHRAKVLPFPG